VSCHRNHQLRAIILAMTIMEKNAQAYGLDQVEDRRSNTTPSS